MADTFVECLVKRKTPGYAALVKSVVIALIVTSLFLAMLGSLIMLSITAAMVLVAIFVFPNFNVEYEYVFLGDELDVDAVLNRSKRKSKGKYLMSRVETVAMKNSSEIRPILNNPKSQYTVVDYTTKNGDAGVYAMVYSDDKGKQLILFEPSEKLLNAMKYNSPRKVIIGC
jgi:hypothetical protein